MITLHTKIPYVTTYQDVLFHFSREDLWGTSSHFSGNATYQDPWSD